MSDPSRHKILMVDDEPNVLSGYQRTIGRRHQLSVAEGGAAALKEMSSNGPFAVIITDMRMPGMSGLEFTSAAQAICKDSIFLMLTGNADQQTAVDAINRGHIFRFLNKPCTPELLEIAITAAVRQHELVTAEHVLLRDTFAGSIKLLVDALELSNPSIAALQSNIKAIQQEVCLSLGIVRDWQLVIASSLSLIGLVSVPTLPFAEAVSNETLKSASALGYRLLINLPRLGNVATMILHQRDAGMLPRILFPMTNDILLAIGPQLLRFTVDLAIQQRLLGSRASAIDILRGSNDYDPRLLIAVATNHQNDRKYAQRIVREVDVAHLMPGMEVASDVHRKDGILILSQGQVLTDLSLVTLSNYCFKGAVDSRIKILLQNSVASNS